MSASFSPFVVMEMTFEEVRDGDSDVPCLHEFQASAL
jgi:hypothetical protein